MRTSHGWDPRIVLHPHEPHLVPNNACVVTTGEAGAADPPAGVRSQRYAALLWLKAAQAHFLHNLQSQKYAANKSTHMQQITSFRQKSECIKNQIAIKPFINFILM